MSKAQQRLAAAVLGAAAVSFAMGQGDIRVAPSALRYEARCDIVDERTVEGVVTNMGPVLLQVAGPVRFSFTVENSMSRPTIQEQGAALIQPGSAMTVARGRLAGGSVLPSESCHLDVSDAVR